MYSVRNTKQSRKYHFTIKSAQIFYWSLEFSQKAIFGSVLCTCIVLAVAILTVCLTISKPYKSCQPTFKEIIYGDSFQYDSYPRSIATGDLNHDNFVDIVVVNSGTNSIGIFLNNGNGAFLQQMVFTTGDCSRPLSIALGDFNNDTHLDITVTNYDTHNIGVFLGYGNGMVATQTTFSTGASRPVAIAVGDFNNDHWLDIVVTNNGTNSISVLFGYANGSFGGRITYSTSYDSLPYSVVTADLNNDQHLDIVVVNYGTDNVGVFLGYGDGHFTSQTTYSTSPRSRPSSIAVNDINNDSYLDIVVANSGTNDISLFLGYGNGSFGSRSTHSISPGSSPYSIIIGDFNLDHQLDLDIAVSNYDTNDIYILAGYGNGSFSIPTIHSTGTDSSPFGMTSGDFDNNNQSDIAVVKPGTNNILVLIGYTMMQSDSPPSYFTGVGSLPRQITIGDFDNDTQVDLAVVNAGTNNVGVFFGYGNGSFREQVTYSTGNGSHPVALAVSDVDNDSRLDIVVANSNTGSLGILYGHGNGTFATVVTYYTGDLSYLFSVIVADFNYDNHADIAFADYGSSNIGIILGYGNRTFGNLTKYSSGTNSRPVFIVAGDFNNDDRLDIAVANFATDNIVIFLGANNGTFTLFTICSTGTGSIPLTLAIADLNKDNRLDIIVTNYGTNNIGVFFGLGNGSFNTQQTYSTGSNSGPSWIIVADINTDSWLDLIVVNNNINNAGVLLNNNYGYFGAQTSYPTGSNSGPQSVTIGGFNKDNRLDVAIVNYGTSNVAILLGHPSEDSANSTINNATVLLGEYYANFRSQTTYSTGASHRPYSIATGDLNNDAQMDILVANSGNESIGILLGHANGSFATEIIHSIGVGSNPRHIIIDDFNQDNQLDVAVTNPRNDSLIVLLGNGNGTFSTEITYSTGPGSKPSALAIGDCNHDTYLDLVVANTGTDTVGIFFGFNYTSFANQTPCDSGEVSNPHSVAIGDLNNDGHLDIVSALYGTNNVGVFLGYGNGTFGSMMTYADVPLSHPRSITVGDFNNDNQLDITVANWGIDSVGVILGYGNGTFTNPMLYSTGSGTRPLSVAVGDFNRDNCLDITTANYGGNSIAVFLGYGNGAFRNAITLSTGTGSRPISITVSDINNDAKPDIIVANQALDNVGIFLGYGNGSFEEQLVFSTGTGSTPQYAIVGDFNKDGRLDIATANLGTSNVGILYGYGNGTFENLWTYATGIGSNPINVNIGDFNNDNQLDIIVGDGISNNVGIFFGYSDGTFASLSTVPVGHSSIVYAVAVGDLNNDHRLDFAIADGGKQNIGVFLADGSTHFGGQSTFFVGEGSRPSSLALSHFNDDSLLDIAVANSATNNIGILLGQGNRMFSNVTTYSTGDDSHPRSLAIGDFNNDSLTDIAVANPDTNNVVVLIGHRNGSFSTLMTYSMDEDSEPVSIATGDFNRDSKLDIAVANSGTNNVCVLFGCGNGSFTNRTFYPLGYNSRPNWIVFKDLNNDGWEDIAVATYGIDNIKILLNLC